MSGAPISSWLQEQAGVVDQQADVGALARGRVDLGLVGDVELDRDAAPRERLLDGCAAAARSRLPA